MMKFKIAYEKGKHAFLDGKRFRENFYTWNNRVVGLAGWWDQGWKDAELESRGRTVKKHEFNVIKPYVDRT